MLVGLPRHILLTKSLFAVKSCMTKSAMSRAARHSDEMNSRRDLSTTAEIDRKSVSAVAATWAGFADDMDSGNER